MFLFTNPARPAEPRPAETRPADQTIVRSVKAAAEATGTSFDYLMRTAKRESNLNPQAKAPTSSATGLFQFIEQTWLGLMKKEGANLGLKAEAEAIQQDGYGRYLVAEPELRRQILELRKDPELASRLAGVFTQKNRDMLRDAIGREPNAGELYMAHFLGPRGARDLITLAQSNPGESAVRAFPEAASANRSIFFDGRGGSRSVREVYQRLASFHSGVDASPTQVAAAQPAAEQSAARSPLAIAPARNATVTGARAENALHGLFRTPTGVAEGAPAMAGRRTRTGFTEGRLNPDAPSFFPRSEPIKVASLTLPAGDTLSDAEAIPLAGTGASPPPAAVEEGEPLVAIVAPLPPVRPKNLGLPLDLARLARKGR